LRVKVNRNFGGSVIIIGIDPGKSGAIARLYQGKLHTIVMPSIEELATYLCEFQVDDRHVFIERCQSFPGQGISSAFNYGRHYGELLGVLVACQTPHTTVHPRVWTKVMHAGASAGEPKARSMEVAKRLFPGHDWRATPRCKKDSDGKIDAALLAEFGRRTLKA
jgi:hypothetical protein